MEKLGIAKKRTLQQAQLNFSSKANEGEVKNSFKRIKLSYDFDTERATFGQGYYIMNFLENPY